MIGWNQVRLRIRRTDINIDNNIDEQKAISEMAFGKASGR